MKVSYCANLLNLFAVYRQVFTPRQSELTANTFLVPLPVNNELCPYRRPRKRLWPNSAPFTYGCLRLKVVTCVPPYTVFSRKRVLYSFSPPLMNCLPPLLTQQFLFQQNFLFKSVGAIVNCPAR